MILYNNLLRGLLNQGFEKKSRAGNVVSGFGISMTFTLKDGFLPMVSCKKLNFKFILGELLWMLNGSNGLEELHKYGIHYWDKFIPEGSDTLGPIYGAQWRIKNVVKGNYGTVTYRDQIEQVIHGLNVDPDGRRHILSTWNVSQLSKMALPPCVTTIQFYVQENKLCSMVTQRSADVFVGLPYDLVQCALLTHLIGKATGLIPEAMFYVIGDAHIYKNHISSIEKFLSREIIDTNYPVVQIKNITDDLRNLDIDDFVLSGYKSHGYIHAPLNVGSL